MILVGCPDLLGIREAGVSRACSPDHRSVPVSGKHEATQAIICTILSASNTSLRRMLSNGRCGGELVTICAEEDGRRLFCMVFNAFFSWRIVGLLQLPPMSVCLPGAHEDS